MCPRIDPDKNTGELSANCTERSALQSMIERYEIEISSFNMSSKISGTPDEGAGLKFDPMMARSYCATSPHPFVTLRLSRIRPRQAVFCTLSVYFTPRATLHFAPSRTRSRSKFYPSPIPSPCHAGRNLRMSPNAHREDETS